MSPHPDERCCAASLLILLPLCPSFQDRLHPSEPKQNKPIPLNWLFSGIWSQQGGSNLTSSPQVPWHNKNIQEAKKSQEFVLHPISPVPALLLQPAASLLQPLPSGTVNILQVHYLAGTLGCGQKGKSSSSGGSRVFSRLLTPAVLQHRGGDGAEKDFTHT